MTRLPDVWPYSLNLHAETVWDAFFIHSLLLDCSERAVSLELAQDAPMQAVWLSNGGVQLWLVLGKNYGTTLAICAVRWMVALVSSYCFPSVFNLTIKTGALRAVVTDGVTLGHPCCSVHDCQEPLPMQCHKHCRRHQHLNSECAVTACYDHAEPGHQTCSMPDHYALEMCGVEAHTAMFQLRQGLKRLKVYHPESTLADEAPGDAFANGEITEIATEAHPNKPEGGNQKAP